MSSEAIVISMASPEVSITLQTSSNVRFVNFIPFHVSTISPRRIPAKSAPLPGVTRATYKPFKKPSEHIPLLGGHQHGGKRLICVLYPRSQVPWLSSHAAPSNNSESKSSSCFLWIFCPRFIQQDCHQRFKKAMAVRVIV